MKKYVKPDVFYESFEMSMGVAACEIQLRNGAVNDRSKGVPGVSELMAIGVFAGECQFYYAGTETTTTTTYETVTSYEPVFDDNGDPVYADDGTQKTTEVTTQVPKTVESYNYYGGDLVSWVYGS